jgi:hypothetical protein
MYPRPSKYSAWLWCPMEKLKEETKQEVVIKHLNRRIPVYLNDWRKDNGRV